MKRAVNWCVHATPSAAKRNGTRFAPRTDLETRAAVLASYAIVVLFAEARPWEIAARDTPLLDALTPPAAKPSASATHSVAIRNGMRIAPGTALCRDVAPPACVRIFAIRHAMRATHALTTDWSVQKTFA